MDALKTIQIANEHSNVVAGVILNKSHKGKYELRKKEIENILGHKVIADVPEHRKVRKALHKKLPVNSLYPRCKVSKEFLKVAMHISNE